MPRLRITLLVSFTLALFTAACSPQQSNTHSDTPLLLISLDGFMPEYLDRVDTPHLDRLIAGGVMAEALTPVFPSKTFPNHYSIATGLFPENTGVVSNTMYDPEFEERFSLGNRDAVTDGRWYGGEPIWVTAEKQGMRAGTMFWVGSEAEIQGIRPTFWNDYDNSVPYNSRVDSIVNWLTLENELQTRLTTLYFSSVDGTGHRHGPNSQEVVDAVENADATIGYLIEQLEAKGIWPNINIIIVSDHGMAEVTPEKIIMLDDIIDLEDVRVVDWTPVAMLQPDEGKKDEIYSQLKAAENNYVVYKKEDIPEEYRIKNHYRVPEIMMIADMNYTITSRSFFESRGVSGATHGWDHRAPEMQGVFVAHGPGFVEGQTIPSFQSVHIYEAMCYLLGLNPAENDGSLETLSPILR